MSKTARAEQPVFRDNPDLGLRLCINHALNVRIEDGYSGVTQASPTIGNPSMGRQQACHTQMTCLVTIHYNRAIRQ
jgi:hypothetical protein